MKFDKIVRTRVDLKAQSVTLSVRLSETAVTVYAIPLADFLVMTQQFRDQIRAAEAAAREE